MSKKLLPYFIILITFLACLFSIYPIAVSLEKLPDQNFVNVMLVTTIPANCDTGDIMCEFTSEEQVISRSSASGLAIKTIEDKTYILTANHFCEPSINYYPYASDETIDQMRNEITVFDSFGNSWSSEIESVDENRDLCLISSNMSDVQSIKFTSALPEIGERVFTMSAPLGVSDKNVVLHFEGIFSGCSNSLNCYFTIPATFGSSGSVIFDKKKRAIGIVLRSLIGFEAVALGVNGSEIIDFLNEAGLSVSSY